MSNQSIYVYSNWYLFSLFLLSFLLSCSSIRQNDYSRFGYPADYKVVDNPNLGLEKNNEVVEFSFADKRKKYVLIQRRNNQEIGFAELNDKFVLEGKYELFIDTNLIILGKHTDGKRDSTWRFYYSNGQLKAINDFVDGDYLGKSIEFDTLGRVESYCSMVDSICHYYIKYDENMNIQEEQGQPWATIFKDKSRSSSNWNERNLLIADPPHLDITFLSDTLPFKTFVDECYKLPEKNIFFISFNKSLCFDLDRVPIFFQLNDGSSSQIVEAYFELN